MFDFLRKNKEAAPEKSFSTIQELVANITDCKNNIAESFKNVIKTIDFQRTKTKGQPSIQVCENVFRNTLRNVIILLEHLRKLLLELGTVLDRREYSAAREKSWSLSGEIYSQQIPITTQTEMMMLTTVDEIERECKGLMTFFENALFPRINELIRLVELQ